MQKDISRSLYLCYKTYKLVEPSSPIKQTIFTGLLLIMEGAVTVMFPTVHMAFLSQTHHPEHSANI